MIHVKLGDVQNYLGKYFLEIRCTYKFPNSPATSASANTHIHTHVQTHTNTHKCKLAWNLCCDFFILFLHPCTTSNNDVSFKCQLYTLGKINFFDHVEQSIYDNVTQAMIATNKKGEKKEVN